MKILTAVYSGKTTTYTTSAIHQYDEGVFLKVAAPGLPEFYEIHFANDPDGIALVRLANSNGAQVPQVMINSGKPVYAWAYIRPDEASGETKFSIVIPVIQRGPYVPPRPTPDEHGAFSQAIAALNRAMETDQARGRVVSLNDVGLATGPVIDAVGIPVYVDDVTEYAEYSLTDPGWYVFARITAKQGSTVTAALAVQGAAGYIAVEGADYVDIAVRFNVAAESQIVTINWGGYTDAYVFRAPDLAIRNLDYRTTFYVYDISPYATWEYAFTADTTFVADKNYFVKDGDAYEAAEVQTVAYQLTADETFQAGKTYYTKDENDEYTAAEVTAGEAVTADTYYEQTTVPVPAYYVQTHPYALTTDATFQDGVTYYTKGEDDTYTAAEVTVGEAVTPDTYYVQTTAYEQAEGTFQDGVTYYTKSGTEYTEAIVTTGDPIPAYYNHSKLTFSGMVRNITYVFNEVVDCPQVYVLPEIEDDTHGCWFEIRLRHSGAFSSTLEVPEGVKVATEHTQAETAGLNMVDLHYTNIDGVKLWRFLNTHSTIPA